MLFWIDSYVAISKKATHKILVKLMTGVIFTNQFVPCKNTPVWKVCGKEDAFLFNWHLDTEILRHILGCRFSTFCQIELP